MLKIILILVKQSAFDGELTINLMHKDNGEYKIFCYKSPPDFAIVKHPKFNEKTGFLEWNREISTEDAKQIISIIEQRSVSLKTRSAMGLDGVTYELNIIHGFNQIKLSWWHHLPEEWAFLQDIPDLLLKLADEESIFNECMEYAQEL